MNWLNTIQVMFDPGYALRTAPEQAILEELQHIRRELYILNRSVAGVPHMEDGESVNDYLKRLGLL